MGVAATLPELSEWTLTEMSWCASIICSQYVMSFKIKGYLSGRV